MTTGILLPCDGSEPQPVYVSGDYTDIQAFVGGLFDCVRREMIAAQFGAEDADDFVAIGYVNDEGLLIGLEENKMASVMFGKRLVGDVLVLSGTSPTGAYDGETYDVPSWFASRVFDGSLHSVAYMWDTDMPTEFSVEEITTAAIAHTIEVCVTANFMTAADAERLVLMMGACDTDEEARALTDILSAMIGFAVFYERSGLTPEQVAEVVREERADALASKIMPDGLTDDMLANFLQDLNKEGE